MRFVCSECGYSVEADDRPEACPSCSAPAASFWALDDQAEAVVVAGSGRRRRRLLWVPAITAVLCLIATPLGEEQIRSPVLRATAGGAPSPSVGAPDGPPAEEPIASEIDRLAPGTVADWRRDPAATERSRAVESPARASGSGGASVAPGSTAAPSGDRSTPGTFAEPTGGTPDSAAVPSGTGGPAAEARPASDGAGESPSCPGARDPPRSVVFVIDASVSMGLPVDIPVEVERMLDARIDAGDREARAVYRQLMDGPTPKRLDFAKTIFAAAIERIPPAFNAGLISFRSCTRIDSLGPVKPDGFAELREHVVGLAVQRGGDTAITESLTLARKLLRGTGGRVMLVTDGQETCHEDPCTVHGDIAQDGIVVDVVDLTGTAALECLAGPTGGQVYRAKGSLDVAGLTRFATEVMDRACAGR